MFCESCCALIEDARSWAGEATTSKGERAMRFFAHPRVLTVPLWQANASQHESCDLIGRVEREGDRFGLGAKDDVGRKRYLRMAHVCP